MMYIIYNGLFIVGFIFYLPFLIFRMVRYGKYREGFYERFAIYPKSVKKKLCNSFPIWIHGASVGEAMAMTPLIERIREVWPSIPILVSTVTGTGREIAQKHITEKEVVIAFPLDFPWIVKSALNMVQPKLVVLMESEVWPNFILQAHKRKIPIVVMNGRISDRSFRRYQKCKSFILPILKMIKKIAVQNKIELEKFKILGLDDHQILSTGNMKYEMINTTQTTSKDVSYWKKIFKIVPEDHVIVAGSTHDGEEQILVNILLRLAQKYPHSRLMVVPRHPERIPAITEWLKANNIVFALRSQCEKLKDKFNIIVVDTIGELRDIYQIANIVFIGKSLTKKGGQNPIEPALFKKPIIFGPHMENFKTIQKEFVDRHAAIQVHDEKELENCLESLILDDAKCQKLGLNAYHLIMDNQGASQRNLQIIRDILKD